ncbi:DUF6194 family protein [Pengzhenrongella sicca]|uniref:DUF6194 domain-containing protein n=1 Tax=Pengzhenrongella sicca TaxID=2819238 RepID=A0A8A4ZHN4_9MICO|nr:DUF6194 family protein [Pengzhenrongella sicca]QTE30473.1 hypothetical protein J4E96_05685 [Pengzhenrongella sicca]
MSIEDIIEYVDRLPGVLILRPQPGDGTPNIAWGDAFFYYAPDGVVPNGQPFATIVTKDYPDDTRSRLDTPGTFRVNIHAGATEFAAVTGHNPRMQPTRDVDPSTPDLLLAHPVYGHLAWVAVVNPAERTTDRVLELLASAYRAARARHDHRIDPAST